MGKSALFGFAMRINFVTLGCKTNQYDAEAMRTSLAHAGHEVNGPGRPCDAVVVNTCAVTGTACAQARQAIRQAVRRRPKPFIVVVGCYPQVAAQEVAGIEGVDLVLGTAERSRLREMLEQGLRGTFIADIRFLDGYDDSRVEGLCGHTRAFVKVQEGCDQACSYCIVPRARGRARRRKLSSIREEAEGLVARNYREIVLTGTHLDEESVFQALTSLEEMPGLRRLRVSSLDPNEVSERLLSHIASSNKCCRHLHIAVQSGDDGILERMRRPYARCDVIRLLERIHGVFGEEVGIGSDFLVGFPGEDEEAFGQTYRLVAEMPFTYLHLFPFSPRPGTAASAMRPVVPQAKAKERLGMLKELGERKKRVFQERCLGRDVEVLVEHRRERGGGWLTGLTDHYLRVYFQGADSLQGRFVIIRVTELNDRGLIGRAKD